MDINNQKEKNIGNEENIFNSNLKSIDFLYNINNKINNKNNDIDSNNDKINSDNDLPKVIYNDFNSSNYSLNAINMNSNKSLK